ncbi:MAG: pantetheine-phosphate adenylyltransferase [Clostridiales bacterium]|jgi:pantetheine-phosphate adenylyltransferase|nr:pantetheine-phosphate adenylyltransferase [Clostridiales bacterium]
MSSIAVYPGTFDPPTCGHLDIITRSAKVFDTLYVAVLNNSDKTPIFSVDERKNMLSRITNNLNNVVITSFNGLLADYAKQINANVIVKGLRAVSDYEYEYQMALINNKINPAADTFFLTTTAENSFLSSSVVKDIARYKGDLTNMVPSEIQSIVYSKLTE